MPAPELATGGAVVVCPGGGYGGLAVDHEGAQILAWLNARGVAGIMLRYRVSPYRHPIPLLDAQCALRTVRANAADWGIDAGRLGIWGFSAGGHLVSTAGTHFDAGDPQAADAIARQSCRPDFLILSYPVITLAPPFTHIGSRYNLLGEHADEALVASLCNDTQVTAQTPPTFLFHTTDDGAVPVENSLLFFQALRTAGVPAEMHIYEHGPHGVGLILNDPILGTWSEHLSAWMGAHGWL